MRGHRALVWAASTAIALGAAFFGSTVHAAGPTTAPSARATTAPSSVSTAKVTPEARQILDQIKTAYGSLKTLQVTVALDANFDVDGEIRNNHADETGSFQAGGKFRNETTDDALIGFTGEKQFVYVPKKNEYESFDAPAGTVDLSSFNPEVADALRAQDMSLALALEPDAAQALLDGADTVEKVADVKVDDVALAALLISQKDMDITLLIDPRSNLVSRETMDLTKMMKQQGAQVVKSATVVWTFKNVANAAANQQFAWTPPAGAQEMRKAAPTAELMQAADSPQLKGQPAPPFSLEGLDGKKVETADLKGSVYVLDFWATWCGPCVESLPELNKIYETNKAAGLKVYAVNLKEEKDQVKQFVKETKLTIPVLLDTDGKIAADYGAHAIPETVVVGRDGKVLEVFIGGGHDEEISQVIKQALKAK